MKKFTLTTLIALSLGINGFSQIKDEPVRNPAGGTAVSQASNSRLILLSPADGKLFNSAEGTKPVLFRWTALVPKPKEAVTYRLKVWQRMQGQSGIEAMRSNQPIVTKDVVNITQAAISNIYTGPCRPPYLCDFVWAVEVLNSEGVLLSNNNSANSSFKFETGDMSATKAEADNKGNAGNTGMPTGKSADKKIEKSSSAAKSTGQGDPVHGVDIKLGIKSQDKELDKNQPTAPSLAITENPAPSVSLNGLPPGQPAIKAGTKTNGDPIRIGDVKLGITGQNKESSDNQPQAIKANRPATQVINLPVEKIEYDAAGNLTTLILKTEKGEAIAVKVVVAGSHSISGGVK